MNTVLLLDGDLIAYRFAAEGETAVEFEPGVWSVQADFDVSRGNCERYIDDLVEKFKADDYVIAVTDKHNFRRDLDPTYKANRKGSRPPILSGPMKEWLREHPKSKIKPGLEADDVQGIISTNPKLYPGARKIIVSIDKDMEQIPGWIWNPMKDVEPRLIDDDTADWKFFEQVLVGDRVDGYPGLPGVGPKKAHRILEDSCGGGFWPSIVAAYEKKDLTEEDALLQARLARILRHEDWDYKKKEPILWTPE